MKVIPIDNLLPIRYQLLMFSYVNYCDYYKMRNNYFCGFIYYKL